MTNPLQGMTLQQLSQQAHNQSGSAYNAYAQQGMNQHMAAQQHRQFNQDWVDRRYMIDGRYMSLQEFMDFIWPEDCADKTFFALKHTKETSND